MEINKEGESLPQINSDEPKTDSFITHFWQLVRLHGSETAYQDTEEQAFIEDHKETGKRSFFKTALIIFPYLLTLSFIASFFWDLHGFALNLAGRTFPMDHLIRIISVSGLIGFATNWLAITMLFKPLEKRPVLGQGLIPAQKKLIASRLSTAVSRDLINPELIRRKMEETGLISSYQLNSIRYIENLVNNDTFRKEFKNLVMDSLRERLSDPDTVANLSESLAAELEDQVKGSRIDQLALKTYTLLKGKDAKQMVGDILHDLPLLLDREWPKVDEFLLKIPLEMTGHKESIEEALSELVYALVESFDVHAIIKENIMKLDEQRLEMLIKGTTNEQLRYIQYLGAVLGSVGGLVIWSPLPAIIFLGLLSLAVWGLDKLAGKLIGPKRSDYSK